MSGFRALPPPPQVEDEVMDDTSIQRYQDQADEYIRSGAAWQTRPEIEPAPSTTTDEDLARVMTATPLFHGGRSKGKAPATRKSTPIPLSEEQKLRAHVQQLAAEKEAALRELQKLKSQQATHAGFLQQTAAQVQNAASSAAAQHAQLSSNTGSALADIHQLILNGQQDNAKQFGIIHHNLKFLHDQGNQRHADQERRFTNIEQRLARLEVHPRTPSQIHQPSPRAAQAGRGFLPPPPRSPLELQQPPRSPTPIIPPAREQGNLIRGNAPLPAPFNGDSKLLEGWILQMEQYFLITGVENELQKMAFIGLSLKGKALDWWLAHKETMETWDAAKEALGLYYGDHYRPDRSYRELTDLKQTGTVRDYLTDVDRLNSYAAIPDRQLINIIISNLSPRLRTAMAHYENLRNNPAAWRQKLIEMDITDIEFHNRGRQQPQSESRRDRGKKRTFEERVHLKERDVERRAEKDESWVSQAKKEKRKSEGRCMRCGMSNHIIAACPNQWRKTPPFKQSTSSQQAHKKARTDKGHFKITELGSEEENQSGNE